MGDGFEITTTASESRDRTGEPAAGTAPYLFLALHCESPLLAGARYRLADLHEVVFGRGPSREASLEEGPDGRVLTVRLPGTFVSRQHARLLRVQSSWVLVDEDSRNGSFVNGKRITRATLSDGDIIECGRTLFVFRAARSAPLQARSIYDAVPTGPLVTLVPELEASHERLVALARSSLPMLLLGESGAGKEVIANAVHRISQRSGAFVAMNCAAIPRGLLESQLFGHVKGAFSGAVRDELGYFRAANEGTLFLDELGDLPLTSQAAFLRALEEGAVVPVGTTRSVPVDVRIIAATNRPLQALVAEGAFRADLLARLAGFTHRLPPLRERIEDLGTIIAALLPKLSDARVSFTPEAGRRLLMHEWPLNVRELRHLLASAIVVAKGAPIEVDHVAPSLANAVRLHADPPASADPDFKGRLTAALTTHRGNVAAVARAFGKAPAQIYRWLKQYGLEADDFREP